MDDSFTSLGGLVLLINLLVGEIIFGGLGTGLFGMVMTAAIPVFLAGLMIGRTPEYLGEKIGPCENKMIALYAIAAPISILTLTAIAVATKAGLAGLTTNTGPHGLTENFLWLRFLFCEQRPEFRWSKRQYSFL
jgi:K+-transporting ATPase ATPase A chain